MNVYNDRSRTEKNMGASLDSAREPCPLVLNFATVIVYIVAMAI